MLNAVDALIDRITMYRLLLYYLIGLLLAAIGLSIFGDLQYSSLAIAGAALLAAASCWAVNRILAFIFRAPINSESSLITGLILALIITPDLSKFGVVFILAASGLAMASKYILAIHRKHIFNPAAVAVVLTALGAHQTASWWVASSAMLPFVLIGGVVVARKIRRVSMVLSFLAATTVVMTVLAAVSGGDIGTSLRYMVLSSAIFFLGFVMLTEPQTSPPTLNKQVWYGVLVGALMSPQVHVAGFYTTPELALVVGNLFAYVVSPKTKLFPTLKAKVRIAANTFDFAFDPGQRLAYQPGQYMEFTLPHVHADARGQRRYFTLASSPTEPELRIGVKFYDQGSSFKHALLDATSKTRITVGQLSGNFTLPTDAAKKVAFVAGGIGVTPFRSMAKYLTDMGGRRDVVMLYSARTRNDLAYAPVFEEARAKIGMRTLYVLSDETQSAPRSNVYFGIQISEDLIRREIPDFHERIFYISGTHPMVEAMRQTLRHMGVPRVQIKTDFFPGYA